MMRSQLITAATTITLLCSAISSGQSRTAPFAPAATAIPGGTPEVLPRPDFHFPGNVGHTILDSDPPQFPQPVKAP
jgi:hypothetical protein